VSGPAPRRTGSNLVAAGILASRVAGVVREQALYFAFGLTGVADAFRAAMRIPNLLQNLLGEGALSASFIPVYARLVEAGDEREASRLAGAVASLLVVVTALLVLAGVLLAEPLVRLLTDFERDRDWVGLAEVVAGASGVEVAGGPVDRFGLAVELTRVTTVGLGFLVLSAWCLGVLNSHRRFFLSYVAPVVWNVAQVAVVVLVVLLGWGLADVAVAAAWAVVAGSVAQLAVQLPAVLRLAPHLRPGLARTPGLDEVLARFGPAVGGRGVVQISSYVDTVLATFLVTGALAAFTLALPLYLLPISVFGFSVAAAELAEMSRSGADRGRVEARLTGGLRRTALAAGFVTAAYLAASGPVVGALYTWLPGVVGRGPTSPDDTIVLAVILSAFAVGLPAAITARVTQNALYAVGDVRGPAVIAAVRLGVAAAASVVLMLQLDWLFVQDGAVRGWDDVPHWPPWERVPEGVRLEPDRPPHLGAAGLALGASMAAWAEWALLRRRLRLRLRRPARSGWAWPVAVAAVVSALGMAAAQVVPVPRPLDAPLVLGIGLALYVAALRRLGLPPPRRPRGPRRWPAS
jgi:putative peptidoglycan lipid II flippase